MKAAAFPPSPYQRICNAALKHKGLRLSAYEIAQLFDDESIRQNAENHDKEDEERARKDGER